MTAAAAVAISAMRISVTIAASLRSMACSVFVAAFHGRREMMGITKGAIIRGRGSTTIIITNEGIAATITIIII
jgi:hypothetical protein